MLIPLTRPTTTGPTGCVGAAIPQLSAFRTAAARKASRLAERVATTFAVGLLAAVVSSPVAAQASSFEIDPDHLSIGFLVSHIGYADVLGMFRSGKGSYRYDESSGALTDVRIEIETASVYTNNRKRDEHLKGPDFLNSAEYPRMVFTAASGRRTNDKKFEIDGQLEMTGKALPMTLHATVNKLSEYELGTFRKPYVMGVSARGSFKRSPYGMTYGVDNGWVGDTIQLIIEFEAQRR